MRDFRDAKAMAQSLRETLKLKSVSLTHSESLELIAKAFGLPDWNFLAARIEAGQPAVHPSVGPAPFDVLASLSDSAGIPVVPMRDLVFFPQMVSPIYVGRDKTKRALDRALATDSRVLLVTQRRAADDDPTFDDLYRVGVKASVIHRATLLDGTLKLFISGLERMVVIGAVEEEDFLAAEVEPFEQTRSDTTEAVALFHAILEAYQKWIKPQTGAMPTGPQPRWQLPGIGIPSGLADTVAPMLPIKIEQKQQLLETADVVLRLEAILQWLRTTEQAA